MIKTRIVEIKLDPATRQPVETELGWCYMGEVPVSKEMPYRNDEPRNPFVVKINDMPHFVIGHSWDINPNNNELMPPVATLVLIVQKIPPQPTQLVAVSGEGAMEQIEKMVPKPGS